MKESFIRALKNVSLHGDTDVFPYPIENSIFYDSEENVLSLLESIHTNFDNFFGENPAFNESQLSPVGYSGFRWVSQIDPLWNVYFLALIISIGERIEKTRIPVSEQCIFSYRFDPSDADKLFVQDIGWRAFHERSLALADEYDTISICDISDFYQRVRHHRIENALLQLDNQSDIPKRINKFLSSFSGTYSHGLPVGGPGARLLSEALLNQTDKLLRFKGIKFCRFADDYHIFTNSEADAFDALLFLSEKLVSNEGLVLQKAKTRIISAAEFKNTSPVSVRARNQDENISAQALLSLSLRFDPYSVTAEEDYETLKSEINKFDILGLLRREVAKSQIDITVTRQIVKSLKFLDGSVRGQAVLSVCQSLESLYPVFPTVVLVLKQIFSELSDSVQDVVIDTFRELFEERSKLIKTRVNQAYACRLLACKQTPENIEILIRLFNETESIMIKRDIILTMFNWRNWAWISDLRSQFPNFSGPLRRAYIIASFCMNDEGKHWRNHNKRSFSQFEKIVLSWATSKSDQLDLWQVPL
jgi:hypothetical protein